MVFSNNLLFAAAAATSGAAPFDSTLIGNSVWLDGSADNLSRSTSSHSSTEVVMACWFQRTSFAGSSRGIMGLGSNAAVGSTNSGIWLGSDDTLYFYNNGHGVVTNQLFRDIGWYHICASWKLDESTATNKGKLFINGEEVTSFSADPRSSWGTSFGSTATQTVGVIFGNTFFDGYVAQPVMLDGQSIQGGDVAITDFVDTFTFGTNGSQIIPKADADIAALASTAGGNSFCLDFSDSSDFGNDISSNNNDLTPNSMAAANQSIHTPSKVYPKVSNIGIPSNDTAANYTMTSGSNRMVYSGANQGYFGLLSTQVIQSDDPPIYWEYYLESGSVGGSSGGRTSVGLCVPDFNVGNGNGFAGAGGNNPSNLRGVIYDNGSQGSTTGSTLIGVGDVQNIAYEPSTGKIWFGVNGTWNNGSETASTTLNPSGHDYQATVQDYVFFIAASRSSDIGVLNFGDNPSFSGNETAGTETDANGHGLFAYAVPSGFFAPVSANLTAPDYQGIDYFDSTIYEGNGTGQRVGDFVPFTDTYTVTNSVMFDDGDSRSLTLNSSATRTSATVAAFSLWTKRANLGTNQRPLTVQVDGNNYFSIYYNTSDQLDFTINDGGSTILQRITTRVFKDNSAWHNIVVIINQGESTQADRVKVFYDGVQIPNDSTGFGTNTCTLDGSSALNFLDSASAVHDVGGGSSTGFTQPYDGYVSEVAFLDGADSGGKLSASDFGQLDTSTNRWVPKDIGSYDFGNTGYYLEFKVAPGTGDGAGTDTSGESNNFTSNGSWATTDQFTDCPSQNYPIFSLKNIGSATATLTEGNLKFTSADNGGFPITMQPTSGKWYFEVELDTAGAYYPGLFTAAGLSYTSTSAWAQASSFVYLPNNANGAVYNGSTVVNGYNTGAMSNGDRLAIAWDVDNRLIYFGLASSGSTTFFSSGDPAAGTGAAPFDLPNERLYFGVVSGGTSAVATHHFISSGWEGAAPTGFSELNQDNLDDTASKITAWAWIKNRDATDSHVLVDRVRGVGEVIHSNETAAEATEPNTVQRFLQRGVQVGNDVQVNTANESYVLWQWLLGDSATTGSTLSGGSPDITSTGIVADAGHFSVAVYEGSGTDDDDISHGLGGTIEMLWVKHFAADTDDWMVWHKDLSSNSHQLHLNTTDAEDTTKNAWGSNPVFDANVFRVGTTDETNKNSTGNSHVFFAFRSIPGVCKVGSYIGNGNADGPYISLGFKPKWIFSKRIDSSSDGAWWQFDTGRDINGNVNDLYMRLNGNNTEPGAGNTPSFDFLSDGFKSRSTYAGTNASGSEYIYMAMADLGGNGTLPPIYGR